MNDYLVKLKVSADCLEKIKNRFDYDLLISVASNYKKINDNLDLLNSYGIHNLEQIFLEKHYIFLTDTQKLVKKFSKYNIPVVVDLINTDFYILDSLLYN